MIVEPQAADDPIKAAQQEIKDLEEILPDIRGKVKIQCQNQHRTSSFSIS